MSLRTKRLLFADAQTTGMRPPAAQLLELGWCAASLHQEKFEIQSRLFPLQEGSRIPKRVCEITGIDAETLNQAPPAAQTADELKKAIAQLDHPLVIIHYAQFEWPFLLDLLGQINLQPICTHQMTKRLFPDIPSSNIRAAAGFFGPSIIGPNRVEPHIRATLQIWDGLTRELEKQGLASIADLLSWLEQPKAKRTKQRQYDYRLDRLKRLNLPDRPGVYRMLDRANQVLYVGKATSLHSRVNSYFRGQKGRDPQKLAMLAQVWDLDVTECETPLEAALLETDEIKRLDPPYNIALKRGRRHLLFYNRDFTDHKGHQSPEYFKGPFRPNGWIETVRLLAQSIAAPAFEQIFFNPLPPEDLRLGFEIFCQQQGLLPQQLRSTRSLLALGARLYRKLGEPEAPVPSEEELLDTEEEQEEVVTPEDIAAKYERLLRRAGGELQRSRKLTQLLNAKVTLKDGRQLKFERGQVNRSPGPEPTGRVPWFELGIETFDRMSILLSELARQG